MKPDLLPSSADCASKEYLDFLMAGLSDSEWTYLMYRSDHTLGRINTWSVLVPDDRIAPILKSQGWPLISGEGNPSCSSSVQDGIVVYEYEPTGSRSGIEPLLFKVEHHHELYEEPWEFSQAMRLLLGLWKSKDGIFCSISDTAEAIIEVEVHNDFARIKTRTLQKLLAMRQLHLMQLIVCQIPLEEKQLAAPDGVLFESDSMRAELYSSAKSSLIPRIQILNAKRVIYAPEMNESYFGTGELDGPVIEFITGIDGEGKETTSPCRPRSDSAADSNFSFLTPVFFDREVLSRYMGKSEIYEFRNGHLWCGYLWSLPIDQNYEDVVMVWLGDLAKLPASELYHWRGANKHYSGRVAINTLKRDLLAQFVDDSTPLDALVKARKILDEVWQAKFGLPLYSKLSDEDQRRVGMLNFPASHDLEAIHQQLVYLHLLLIEPLHEKALSYPDPATTGSLNRLEAHLKTSTQVDSIAVLKPLRHLNDLRNKTGSHRIGSEGQGYLEAIRSDRGTRLYFEKLATELTESLIAISEAIIKEG